MEIWTPCAYAGCKEKAIVEEPFSTKTLDDKERLLRENGWVTRINERGKKEHYCPDHAEMGAGVKIYAASSWRNGRHPEIVEALRAAGHEVYDFRNPPDPGAVFYGEDADLGWFTDRDPHRIKEMLDTPQARRGFASDMAGLDWADACVLTLPCGRSAHLELGYAIGAGKPGFVLLDGESEPELMYRMVEALCADLDELIRALRRWREQPRERELRAIKERG